MSRLDRLRLAAGRDDELIELHGEKGKPGYALLHSPHPKVRARAQAIYDLNRRLGKTSLESQEAIGSPGAHVAADKRARAAGGDNVPGPPEPPRPPSAPAGPSAGGSGQRVSKVVQAAEKKVDVPLDQTPAPAVPAGAPDDDKRTDAELKAVYEDKSLPRGERTKAGRILRARQLGASPSTAKKAEDKPSREWRTPKVRRTRAEVQPIADKLEAEIKRLNPGLEFHFGGSWRRNAPTVGDLDVVFITKDGRLDKTEHHPAVVLPPSVSLQRGQGKIAQGDITVNGVAMHVDFWSASEKERGAFLWFITGPKELNVSMRTDAIRKGFNLSQEALYKIELPDKLRGMKPDSPPPESKARELLADYKRGSWTRPYGEELQSYIDKPSKAAWDRVLKAAQKKIQVDDGTEADVARKLGPEWEKFADPKSRDSWAAPTGDTEKVKIKSSSGSGEYTVTRSGDRYKCECKAYQFRKTCSHIDKAKKIFAEKDASSPAAESASVQIVPKAPSTLKDTRLAKVTALVPQVPEKQKEAEAPKPVTTAPAPPRASASSTADFMPMQYLEIDANDPAQMEKFFKDDNYFFQQKIDGHRGSLVIEPGKKPWMKAKHGREYNQSTNNKFVDKLKAELVAKGAIPKDGPSYIVDGELLNGKYHVFDMVIPGQEDMPWEARMKLAEQWVDLVTKAGVKDIIALPTARTQQEKRSLWKSIKETGKEGAVVKRKSAPYKQAKGSGSKAKSADILKAKVFTTADVVVTGLGTGARGGENVTFGVWDNGKMHPVGGASLIGKEKQFGSIKVGDVVEVKYLWASKDNMLNIPAVVGVRRDKTKEDTGLAQLRFVDKSVLDKAVMEAGSKALDVQALLNKQANLDLQKNDNPSTKLSSGRVQRLLKLARALQG